MFGLLSASDNFRFPSFKAISLDDSGLCFNYLVLSSSNFGEYHVFLGPGFG